MDLTQSGSTISGTGLLCANYAAGPKSFNFSVTGTTGNTNAQLSWAGANPVISTDNLSVNAALANGTLAVNTGNAGAVLTANLQTGNQSQFADACRTLPVIAPYSGQWYGQSQLNATSNGSNVSAQVEVFMDITQDSSANLSGSGKLCANANGSAQDIATFTISGSAANSPATLRWSDSSGQSSGTASISNQQMSISLSDPNGTGTLTGTLQKGSQQDYTTACAALPPVTTG